jgi:metal-responsive CopG/Arc/MetJ family transcriptional regulator
VKYTETVHFKTTTEQLELIDSIASKYGKSRSETIRDMLNLFILITESDVTLSDLIVAAIPTLTKRLINSDLKTAVAIFGKPDPVITNSEM